MPSFFGRPFEKVFSFQDVFTDDLRKSTFTKNPTIIPEIDLVYVLSGRSTFLNGDADKLKRPFDTSDDKDRMLEGIRIATEICALRAGKKIVELRPEDYVIPIFYNGRKIHNQHLRTALDTGLINYPSHLFLIHEIETETTTIGQKHSFTEYLAKHNHKNIAIVSSAYHIPRVARTFGNQSPQTWDSLELKTLEQIDVNIFLFGVHKQELRTGIEYDLRGEQDAMFNRCSNSNPILARYQSSNTFMTDEDFIQANHNNRALFWKGRGSIPSITHTFPIAKEKALGTLKLITHPNTINREEARTVLVESFIGEYSQYLEPKEIDTALTCWRKKEKSVEVYYQKYFDSELHEFATKKLEYWVEARIGNKLVGWATFERHDNSLYMNLLVVHPDYQRKSIGSHLVASIVELGLISDIKEIHILLRKKNQVGHKFYTSLGFEINHDYKRDNFVDVSLLQAFTWKNPGLNCGFNV